MKLRSSQSEDLGVKGPNRLTGFNMCNTNFLYLKQHYCPFNYNLTVY